MANTMPISAEVFSIRGHEKRHCAFRVGGCSPCSGRPAKMRRAKKTATTVSLNMARTSAAAPTAAPSSTSGSTASEPASEASRATVAQVMKIVFRSIISRPKATDRQIRIGALSDSRKVAVFASATAASLMPNRTRNARSPRGVKARSCAAAQGIATITTMKRSRRPSARRVRM